MTPDMKALRATPLRVGGPRRRVPRLLDFLQVVHAERRLRPAHRPGAGQHRAGLHGDEHGAPARASRALLPARGGPPGERGPAGLGVAALHRGGTDPRGQEPAADPLQRVHRRRHRPDPPGLRPRRRAHPRLRELHPGGDVPHLRRLLRPQQRDARAGRRRDHGGRWRRSQSATSECCPADPSPPSISTSRPSRCPADPSGSTGRSRSRRRSTSATASRAWATPTGPCSTSSPRCWAGRTGWPGKRWRSGGSPRRSRPTSGSSTPTASGLPGRSTWWRTREATVTSRRSRTRCWMRSPISGRGGSTPAPSRGPGKAPPRRVGRSSSKTPRNSPS